MGSVDSVIDAGSKKDRLSRFYHSLNLAVSDWLHDTRCLATAIGKASKLSSILHQSQIFRDAFEQEFGQNTSIPASVGTRWNSNLR